MRWQGPKAKHLSARHNPAWAGVCSFWTLPSLPCTLHHTTRGGTLQQCPQATPSRIPGPSRRRTPPGRPCWRGGRLVVTLLRWSPSSEAPSKRRTWAPSSAAGGAASGRRRWTSASRCGGAGTWPPGRPLCALAPRTAPWRTLSCLPARHPANGNILRQRGPRAARWWPPCAPRPTAAAGLRTAANRLLAAPSPLAGQVPAGPEDRVRQLWRYLHRCVRMLGAAARRYWAPVVQAPPAPPSPT